MSNELIRGTMVSEPILTTQDLARDLVQRHKKLLAQLPAPREVREALLRSYADGVKAAISAMEERGLNGR